MIGLLIRKVDNPEPAAYKKGDIVNVDEESKIPPDGETWNSERHVYLKVDGITYEQAKEYVKHAYIDLSFSAIWSATKKGYRITVTNQSLLNDDYGLDYGNLSKDLVEKYINKWGGVVFSFSSNSVTFDVGLFAAATSNKVFEKKAEQANFTENSWNAGTSTMEILVEYSGITNEQAEQIILDKGFILVNHPNSTSTIYSLTNTSLNTYFKNDIETEFNDRIVMKQRYYISGNVVDFIESQGGIYNTDKNTLISYLNDRVVS